jgi:hypothetical protein
MPFKSRIRPNSTVALQVATISMPVAPLYEINHLVVPIPLEPPMALDQPLSDLTAANQYVKTKAIEFLKPNEKIMPSKVRQYLWSYFLGKGTRKSFALIIAAMLIGQTFNIGGLLMFQRIVDSVSMQGAIALASGASYMEIIKVIRGRIQLKSVVGLMGFWTLSRFLTTAFNEVLKFRTAKFVN